MNTDNLQNFDMSIFEQDFADIVAVEMGEKIPEGIYTMRVAGYEFGTYASQASYVTIKFEIIEATLNDETLDKEDLIGKTFQQNFTVQVLSEKTGGVDVAASARWKGILKAFIGVSTDGNKNSPVGAMIDVLNNFIDNISVYRVVHTPNKNDPEKVYANIDTSSKNIVSNKELMERASQG